VAIATCLLLLLVAAGAGAAEIDSLKSKLATAKSEAGQIREQLIAAHDELAAAETEAKKAEARETKLGALLAEGEAKAARLAGAVRRTHRQLKLEKRRLRRAEAALADRLVAIYESGTPSEESLVLGSADMDELTTRTSYLEQVHDADTALAARVGDVRDTVRAELKRVAELKVRADEYDARLAAARAEIGEVRAAAEAAAGRLEAVSAERTKALSSLKSKMDDWIGEIEAAEAASREAAEEEVGRWLGGPYAIPAYIVMCESGGDYGAVNPSSGAGGAYQILPSTWDLYDGQGAPQEAPKAEQDRIAGEIWADSGPGAWVCG
jgi:septal ring factor EnvC (AmiA/AmiB activator)